MRCSSMVFPSLSSHCSSADEIISFCDNLALRSSFWALIFCDNLARPCFRTSIGFQLMGGHREWKIGWICGAEPRLVAITHPCTNYNSNLVTLAYTKCMGFSRKRVWGMGYSGPMGYGLRIPANQLGGWRGLWDVRGYGLFPIWVMRGSTVVLLLH